MFGLTFAGRRRYEWLRGGAAASPRVRDQRREARHAHEDCVILADGSVVVVPRANLAAAKALLAAQKAAERRVAPARVPAAPTRLTSRGTTRRDRLAS